MLCRIPYSSVVEVLVEKNRNYLEEYRNHLEGDVDVLLKELFRYFPKMKTQYDSSDDCLVVDSSVLPDKLKHLSNS